MKRSILLLMVLASVVFAQNGKPEPKVEAKSAPPEVVAPNETDRLVWENHRLRGVNIQLQISNLQKDLEKENQAADAQLDKMQKAIGEKYSPQINPQTQKLEFVLKKTEAKPGDKK